MRKEQSTQNIEYLVAKVNEVLGDTQSYLNTHTGATNSITEIKMLASKLNSYISQIDIERVKNETLNSVCLSLTLEEKMK